ncbi:MAG: hypothetical protein BRD40_03295 [Bacteroidetes bacterium QS_1_65_9]|nr:MAG: hypothetical protein BRD40_03295 [Bacteroidetes bacterium QS_1_65_9]
MLTLASACAAPAGAQPTRTGPATWTAPAQTAARAGLTRATDLFSLFSSWNAPALDGYTLRPEAAGMPAAPLLVVGGQPLEGGPFGRPPLPILPVHLKQLRSLSASSAPQLAAGRLAADGAVRLRTRRVPRGLSARGAFSAGNEVGDPGPYRSTRLSKTNVDRIGPQYFGETGFGTNRLRAQLSALTVRHYTTDPRIRSRTNRFRNSSIGPPLQELIAPRLMVEARPGARYGRHRFHTQYARLRALSYFPTLGSEVPAQRRHLQAGLAGTLPFFLDDDAPGRSRYRLSYTRNTLASEPSRLRILPALDSSALTFDWAARRLSGNVDAPVRTFRAGGHQKLGLRLGLSADYTRAVRPSSLTDPSLLTTRAYARLTRRTRDSTDPSGRAAALRLLRPALTVAASQTDGQLGVGALLSGTLRINARQQLGAHFAYARRPYAAGGPFWYWQKRGLHGPQASDDRVTVPSSFPASRRLTADLRIQNDFKTGGHVATEFGVRHLWGLTLPYARFAYDTTGRGGGLTPDPLHLRTGAAGQTFRVAFEGERAFPEGLNHQLRYDFFAHHVLRTGERRAAFEQRFQRTPRHRLRYTAQLSAGERFSLEGRFTLRSPERWPAYRRAARAAGSPYRRRLPTYALLDLTAAKRFWRDHLRLRLALRNAFDAPRRTHPAGPARRLNLFLSLEAQL